MAAMNEDGNLNECNCRSCKHRAYDRLQFQNRRYQIRRTIHRINFNFKKLYHKVFVRSY